MSFDHTITEHEIEANALRFAQGLQGSAGDREPDLVVDGLSESILSRILGLFGVRKS